MKKTTITPKLTPFLWFDREAEEAARFYVKLFGRGSKILEVTRYGEAGREAGDKRKGSVLTVSFLLCGQPFTALNGGPGHASTGPVSFVVNCATAAEVDKCWNGLAKGGKKSPCGWVTDKYGLSWQVVPVALFDLLKDRDAAKVQRVVDAYLKMQKLDLKALKRAHAGK